MLEQTDQTVNISCKQVGLDNMLDQFIQDNIQIRHHDMPYVRDTRDTSGTAAI